MAATRQLVLSLALATLSLGVRINYRRNSSVRGVNERFVRYDRTRQYQVYWPTTQQSSCSAILFSVGTAMGVSNYGDFAASMVAKGFVFIMVDPEPGSMTKLNKGRLQDAYLTAKDSWAEWTDNACGSIDAWILGGHSAGGGTAHKVFVDMPNITDAVFSVDPFAMGDLGASIDLPGLYVGFSEQTCSVDPVVSSQAGYAKSAPTKRALAKVTVERHNGDLTFHHCSISGGCSFVCRSGIPTPASFFHDVATMVETFAHTLTTNQWARFRSSMEALPISTPLQFYINEDTL